MPISALPDNYKLGPDNQSWLMRLKKKIQFIFAAGPKVPSGFFRWREFPISIFAVRGKGAFRLETSEGEMDFADPTTRREFMRKWYEHGDLMSVPFVYLSRIQPWCRWHISLQWPLLFNFHVIYRKRDVAQYPTYKSAFGITKMFTFGIGFKRDGDKVYWLTANIGGNFE